MRREDTWSWVTETGDGNSHGLDRASNRIIWSTSADTSTSERSAGEWLSVPWSLVSCILVTLRPDCAHFTANRSPTHSSHVRYKPAALTSLPYPSYLGSYNSCKLLLINTFDTNNRHPTSTGISAKMHHRHGFSVTLSHAEGEYEEHPVPIDEARWTSEYPENTRLDGGCNSTVSQVAITRTLEPAGAEAFTCRLTLWGNFEWFSASALRVIVRYGTQGHKNSVNTCIIRRHAPSTRAGTLVVRKFPDLCGLLPPPQADGAELSRTWSTRWVANPGSVAVFLTRGHVCKAGALGSSGPDPRESQQARTLNGVAASRIFKPLKSYNGATYCFEFQVRPKGGCSVECFVLRLSI